MDENQFNTGKQSVAFEGGALFQGGHLVFTGPGAGAKSGMPGFDSKFKEAAEGNTILGEQQKVIEDLYSILAHTGSTNSGFEFGIPAWTTRDPRAPLSSTSLGSSRSLQPR